MQTDEVRPATDIEDAVKRLEQQLLNIARAIKAAIIGQCRHDIGVSSDKGLFDLNNSIFVDVSSKEIVINLSKNVVFPETLTSNFPPSISSEKDNKDWLRISGPLQDVLDFINSRVTEKFRLQNQSAVKVEKPAEIAPPKRGEKDAHDEQSDTDDNRWRDFTAKHRRNGHKAMQIEKTSAGGEILSTNTHDSSNDIDF